MQLLLSQEKFGKSKTPCASSGKDEARHLTKKGEEYTPILASHLNTSKRLKTDWL